MPSLQRPSLYTQILQSHQSTSEIGPKCPTHNVSHKAQHNLKSRRSTHASMTQSKKDGLFRAYRHALMVAVHGTGTGAPIRYALPQGAEAHQIWQPGDAHGRLDARPACTGRWHLPTARRIASSGAAPRQTFATWSTTHRRLSPTILPAEALSEAHLVVAYEHAHLQRTALHTFMGLAVLNMMRLLPKYLPYRSLSNACMLVLARNRDLPPVSHADTSCLCSQCRAECASGKVSHRMGWMMDLRGSTRRCCRATCSAECSLSGAHGCVMRSLPWS